METLCSAKEFKEGEDVFDDSDLESSGSNKAQRKVKQAMFDVSAYGRSFESWLSGPGFSKAPEDFYNIANQ